MSRAGGHLMRTVRPITLEGRQVRLEPLSLAHLDDLAELIHEPEIWQFMGFGQLNTLERLKAWIEKALLEPAQGTGLPFAVVKKGGGKACGSTSLYQIVPQHRRLEVGRTWLGKPYWRSAVNTESKYLLLRHAFEELGCIRVELKASVQNLRSQRAIERLGATREGVLRAYSVRQDGSVSDILMYSILAPEWPEVKARLEGML